MWFGNCFEWMDSDHQPKKLNDEQTRTAAQKNAKKNCQTNLNFMIKNSRILNFKKIEKYLPVRFPVDDEVSRQLKRNQILSNAKYTFMIKKFLEKLYVLTVLE